MVLARHFKVFADTIGVHITQWRPQTGTIGPQGTIGNNREMGSSYPAIVQKHENDLKMVHK